jgi:hypothetical protein
MKNSFYLLVLGLALVGCGKDDSGTAAGGSTAAAIQPAKDFSALSGVSTEAGTQMVCPYEELAGYYKLSASDCSNNGEKAELDYMLVPTRFTVDRYAPVARGYIEMQYTRDGSEVLSQVLDFPRLPNGTQAQTLGLQCGVSEDGATLTLKQACPGTSGKDCFYSVIKKGGKVSAFVSQMRKGMQYWCKVNLRKVDPAGGQ